MKHTLDELLDIVYRYYPRGVGITDDNDIDIQAIQETEEHARLVAARLRAATDERWHAMRRRISARFPGMLMNHSLHLPTGNYDACYSFTIDPPDATDGRTMWFHASFLAPYYILYSSRLLDIETQVDRYCIIVHGMQFFIRRSAAGPALMSNLDDEKFKRTTVKQGHITFDLSPEERPYAAWIAREIEATFGCEYMPPEVGTVLVPELATPKLPGEVRLYDCLFRGHEWVNPSPSEARSPSVEVDASHLTDRFIAVLTVLAALDHILLMLMPEVEGCGVYWGVTTDGVLHKEEVLALLAKIRQLIEPPVTARGIAARREIEATTRELEALVAAWEGDGAPSDAMVASASRFLDHWVVSEDSE